MLEAAIERCSLKMMLFQPILDFDNKLKEGTQNFNELFKRYK